MTLIPISWRWPWIRVKINFVPALLHRIEVNVDPGSRARLGIRVTWPHNWKGRFHDLLLLAFWYPWIEICVFLLWNLATIALNFFLSCILPVYGSDPMFPNHLQPYERVPFVPRSSLQSCVYFSLSLWICVSPYAGLRTVLPSPPDFRNCVPHCSETRNVLAGSLKICVPCRP